MSKSTYIPFAITSGFFAASSSVFAKLFSDERTVLIHTYISELFNIVPAKTSLLFMRIVCFILIFGCNSIMWTTFTKALNLAPSSVQVSIVNGAINFSASAILGHLIFDEPLAFRWWIGAAFILTGTVILSHAQTTINEQTTTRPKHE
ncbi:hypothetical protein BDF20DRAFT_526808 [Mycotypha africana]|uniref:uncharacterized protein n=1 Tax=Mycotypha africana TaxID=64632 RepID=UPI00230020FA|nr:uncharacterized protein BDF20DRAFT_526808 [Mycotypha africana]KAI8979709.1 hypothetical protein BDF20DRAFT_526808 [Mycotypha africana]